MPIKGQTVGRDTTLVVLTASGAMRLDGLLDFDCKQTTPDEHFKLLSGQNKHLPSYDGWTGTFSIKRDGPEIDQYFNQLEDDQRNGRPALPCSITDITQEPNGAISQYLYTDVTLFYEDSGQRAGTKSVTQKIKFTADRRITQS